MLRINPLKLFTILLVLSVGLGLSVKNFLKSDYLNSYISQKLLVVSSKNTKFNYKDFNLFVSKSHFVPTLVLQVNEVSFFVPDKCRSQLNIVAKKVLSPINIISALWYREDIRLSVDLENVLVERKPYQCKNNFVSKKVEEPDGNPTDFLKKYIETGIKRIPRLNYLSFKLAKRLKLIKVNNLKYTDLMGGEKVSKLNMNFEKLRINFKPGIINVSSVANWPYHKILGENLQIPVFRFSTYNNTVSMKLLGKIREGHISFDAKVSEEDSSVSIDARVKQAPLGESVKIVRNVLGSNINYNSALSWLNCHLRIKGTVNNIFSQPQKINDCQVVGELGEWNLSPYDLKLTALNMQTEPLQLSVKKARIKKVIDFFGIKNHLTKIKKFGLFSGGISWQPTNHNWKSSGVIKNLELELDHEKKKLKQLVKSFNFESSGLKNNYNIKAKDFELQDASLDGEIEYNYNHLDRTGKVNAKISNLVLGEALQKSIWNANTEFYEGAFKGVVRGSKYSLSGKLSSKALESAYVSSGPYDVNLRITDGSVGGNIVFSSLNFSEKLYDIKNLNLERVISKEILPGLKFYKSHLDFQLDSESMIWKLSNFKNRYTNPNLVFTSFGTVNDISMYSQLDFFIPKKAITWAWRGSLEKFKLDLLKSFRGDYKGLKKSPAVKDVIAKTKVKKESLPIGIKNKILKRAKEILPIKGN